MKRLFLILLLGTTGSIQAAQNDFALYWVGNSLMMGGWACYEGWDFVGRVMINPDSGSLGMAVHSAALKRGATDVPSQWQQDAAGQGTPSNSGPSCIGISELNTPTGCTTYQFNEPWCATRSNYDYLLLQGYRWTATMADTEYKYCSLYYDLGLSNGTKPIIFACWQSPQTADEAIAIYDSLFRKYRSRGAIYAPVIQAHRLVWNDPAKDAATYLYDNDPYHHVNGRGAFIMDCVFYEVFTGHSPVGITAANLKRVCTDARMDSISAADIAYIEAKAHQAVVDYYGAGNAPHLGVQTVNVVEPAAPKHSAILLSRRESRQSFDLSGRALTLNRTSATGGLRIVAARDAAGRTGIALIGDR